MIDDGGASLVIAAGILWAVGSVASDLVGAVGAAHQKVRDIIRRRKSANKGDV